MIYLVSAFYFIVSGLSFIDYMPDYFYAIQSQAEVFIAFMIGAICMTRNKPSFLWAFCIYSLYILITDFLYTNVSIEQWAIEVFIFLCVSIYMDICEEYPNIDN